MNVSSCSTVGLRNSGAVSAMKSVQNLPGSSSAAPSAGSARSTSSSMNPSGASLPAQELSAANTIRWPRSRRMAASPMHWFVGPYADSGQNMTVSGLLAPMAVPSTEAGLTDHCATVTPGASAPGSDGEHHTVPAAACAGARLPSTPPVASRETPPTLLGGAEFRTVSFRPPAIATSLASVQIGARFVLWRTTIRGRETARRSKYYVCCPQ